MSNRRFSPLDQARDRLQRAIAQHRQIAQKAPQKTAPRPPIPQSASAQLAEAIAPELEQLTALLHKLDQKQVHIAIFGLVSRGKSALLNALVGRPLLETGPINGITREPVEISWTPPESFTPFQVKLIDTPGLDEIGGQARADMAEQVAQGADLILFVLAGDMTRQELQAIRRLWRFQKPILLVFNKIDLYPAPDRRTILANLQQYLQEDESKALTSLPLRHVLQVAADPAPLKVQTEWPDGRISQTWERPPPQIDELLERLAQLLQGEGAALLALNALVQTRELEQSIAQKTLTLRRGEAETLIWRFARTKAIAIAANPLIGLDLLGGALTDLALIRALARLYGLPMTGYEAGRLLRKILISSGGLLLAETGSGLVFGVGKGLAALSSLNQPAGLMAYGGAAIAQGAVAGYGSYIVGQAAQIYLEQGCTWGETGANTLIRSILEQVDKASILYRLRSELGA